MTAERSSESGGDPLRLQAEHRPTAVALEADERTWTYEAMDRGADELATQLSESGLGPGDIVAAWVDPTPAGIASVHGVPRLGGVLAPGHARWSEAERAGFLARLRPRAVIGDADSPPPAGKWTERRVALEALGGAELSLFRPCGRTGPRRLPEDAHTLLWTSGTEGEPRLVCLSLRSQLHNARVANRRLGFGSDDGWLLSLGLAHVGGLAITLRSAVAGARLVLAPSHFEPDRMLELVRDGGVTHVSVVPTMLDRLLEADSGAPLPERLRCLLIGGDATPADCVSRALDRGWPLALTYGLTEAASQVATARPELVRRKPGTVGAALDGVTLRIATDGEIWVGGPTVMLGYLRVDDVLDGVLEGWVPTGDRGRLDEEGDLWVTGRTGSRIVTGGSNVDPVEIEEVLSNHAGVRAVCVVGVPDEVWGERVVAVIVPHEPSAVEPGVLRAELGAWASQELSGPRYPRTWVLVDRLPLTRTGKPDRTAVRKLAALDVMDEE